MSLRAAPFCLPWQCPYFSKFLITIKSVYVEDRGESENVRTENSYPGPGPCCIDLWEISRQSRVIVSGQDVEPGPSVHVQLIFLGVFLSLSCREAVRVACLTAEGSG